ncbi:MAG: hypothetical protein ACE5HB_02455 [Terriglobia bacterium]
MPALDQIARRERDAEDLLQVAALTETLLTDSRLAPPPADNRDEARSFVRSARDLLRQGEHEAANQLLDQAEEAVRPVRQWLAVADLSVTPFRLRTHCEKKPPAAGLRASLARYYLNKSPHADNDRDKLDYLLTSYFAQGSGEQAQALLRDPQRLRAKLDSLFRQPTEAALSGSSVVMLHELESLIAQVEEYDDFDGLVRARMVERVRTLKTNLGAEFYHPEVLPTLVRFNLAFRRRFELLLEVQLETVRAETGACFEKAWDLIRQIEEIYEEMALPELAVAKEEAAAEDAHLAQALGRPEDVRDERPPLERLVRAGRETQKENDLKGILNRMSRFLARLSPEQAQADTVIFPLRPGPLPLAPWEREAFSSAAKEAAPESTEAIRYGLGLMAWMEEELARYQQVRDDRYLWKTHFDLLSYAVTRSLDLLRSIKLLLREDASEGEQAWFGSLYRLAHRLAGTLNRVAPVFHPPADK